MTAGQPGDAEQWVLEGVDADDIAWLGEQLQAGILGEELDWHDPSEGRVLTDLFEAVEHNRVAEVAELLPKLGGCSVDTLGPEGDTLLHLACLYSGEECVKLLLKHGASATVRDEEEGSCLHDASASGSLPIVKLLLDKAPELVNAVDNDGDTALHNAARGGCVGIVECLLLEGANPNLRNNNGETPRETCAEDIEPNMKEMLEVAEQAFSATSC